MKFFIATLLLCTLHFISSAQSVAINSDASAPDPSAILDVKASGKGVLFPRMTQAERTGITEPAKGLLVYQTDGVEGYYYNAGTPLVPVWTRIAPEKSTVAFSATSSVTQVWSSGAPTFYTKLQFPTEEYDESSNFTPGATSEFAAPSAGVYHFDAMVALTGASNNRYDIALFVNGIQKKNTLGWLTTSYMTLQISTDLKLNAADIVDLRIGSGNGGGGGQILSGSPQWMYFNGHKVN